MTGGFFKILKMFFSDVFAKGFPGQCPGIRETRETGRSEPVTGHEESRSSRAFRKTVMTGKRALPVLLLFCLSIIFPGGEGQGGESSFFSLRVVREPGGPCLLNRPVRAGDCFYLEYTHSSDLTPVRDTFIIDEAGRIRIVSEEYAWYGAGLEFQTHGGQSVRFGEKRTVVTLDRPMDPFYLRVGRTANHVLTVGGKAYPLKTLAEGGDRVRIFTVAEEKPGRKEVP